MSFVVALTMSIVLMALFIILAMVVTAMHKVGKFIRPLNILILGVFVSGLILYFPMYQNGSLGFFEVLMNAIHDVFQLFTVDSSFDILEGSFAVIPQNISKAYLVWFCILYGITPFLTFGFILSLFKNLDAYRRYYFHYHYDVYAFSELNERSLALAESISESVKNMEPNWLTRQLKHWRSIFDYKKKRFDEEGNLVPFIERHCKAITVFCGVKEDEEDDLDALVDRARRMGAILFEKDIDSVRLKKHSSRKNISVFMISENESQNIDVALGMSDLYGCCGNVHFYVFSDSAESELLLNNVFKGNRLLKKVEKEDKTVEWTLSEKNRFTKKEKKQIMKELTQGVAIIREAAEKSYPGDDWSINNAVDNWVVDYMSRVSSSINRINIIRSLVYHVLHQTGIRLFKDEVEDPDTHEISYQDYSYAARSKRGERIISAVVIGMGLHGTEMVKALAWFGQMVGYEIHIHAFDRSETAKSHFAAKCPELVSPKFNNLPEYEDRDEDSYHINIETVDIDSDDFVKRLGELPPVTYVMVCLGDDEKNLEEAVRMRTLCARFGWTPFIQAIRYNIGENEDFKNATNFKGQKYRIDLVGDMKSIFSDSVITSSDLEALALERHRKWGSEHSFWAYEYNYRSSVASALHHDLKIKLKLPGADLVPADRNDTDRNIIRRLEHRRWNAYMRAEGYVYSPVRNDLAKQHPCLVLFDQLPYKEKIKDDD